MRRRDGGRGRGGVHEAYRQLLFTCMVHRSPEVAIAQLKEIRDYLGTTDPTTLGAAFLLEEAGYVRAYDVMTLPFDIGEEPVPCLG